MICRHGIGKSICKKCQYDAMANTLISMWNIKQSWGESRRSNENTLLSLFDLLDKCIVEFPKILMEEVGLSREEEMKENAVSYIPTKEEIALASKKIRECHYAESSKDRH